MSAAGSRAQMASQGEAGAIERVKDVATGNSDGSFGVT
jgi:hypothetical protein